MEANKVEIKTLFVALVSIACLEAITKAVSTRGLFSQTLILLGLVRLLEIIVLTLVVSIWGDGLASIGLDQPKMAQGFQKGLIWSAGFGIIILISFSILYWLGINALALIHMHLPKSLKKIILFFFVGGIVGPIAEEIFFRGILYGFFRRWGVVIALIVSTLLFVLAHPVLPGIPVTQVGGGIVFALAYEKERSLMVPLTIHVLGNMAIFTLSLCA
jgi:membrane protease YdiL (CAAX protease family)